MKIKALNIIIIIYLIVDVLHYFTIRINPEYSNITEAFYESNQTTFIKWGLCLLSVIGLFLLEKQKATSYVLIIASISMIWLFIVDGPLNHLLLWYSTISLWILGVLGVYLLYLSGKKILNK